MTHNLWLITSQFTDEQIYAKTLFNDIGKSSSYAGDCNDMIVRFENYQMSVVDHRFWHGVMMLKHVSMLFSCQRTEINLKFRCELNIFLKILD